METLAQLKKQYPHLANGGWYLKDRAMSARRQERIDSVSNAERMRHCYLMSLLRASNEGEPYSYDRLGINEQWRVVVYSSCVAGRGYEHSARVTGVIVPHCVFEQTKGNGNEL